MIFHINMAILNIFSHKSPSQEGYLKISPSRAYWLKFVLSLEFMVSWINALGLEEHARGVFGYFLVVKCLILYYSW